MKKGIKIAAISVAVLAVTGVVLYICDLRSQVNQQRKMLNDKENEFYSFEDDEEED